MVVDPGFHPIMSDLLLTLAASQRQAGHQSCRNAPISTESDQQATLSAGIAATILETLQRREASGAERRLFADLLVHVAIEGLHLVARFGLPRGQLLCQSGNISMVGLDASLVV